MKLLNSWPVVMIGLCLAGCQSGPPRAPEVYQDQATFPIPTQSTEPSAVSAVSQSATQPDGELELVAFQQDESPGEELQLREAPLELIAPGKPQPKTVLQLSDVLLSVEQSYPQLIAAGLDRQIAQGANISALGEFDLKAKTFGIAMPEGFYENYRAGASLEQPLPIGGYLYGGYKFGDGKFQPWFKERETNEGGEFSGGFGLPLLQGLAIDERRANVAKTSLAEQAVAPAVRRQWLEFAQAAANAYWKWVAAGLGVEANRTLLQLARVRVANLEERIQAGDLERIYGINNQQLIASRENKLIESERKFQAAAIKLSLFFRNEQGSPMLPDAALLPLEFPPEEDITQPETGPSIERALATAPEIRELQLQIEQAQIDLSLAQNQTLPQFDATFLASQDIGNNTSSNPDDKSDFELEVGLYGEVPLQRRKAFGKIRSTRGKLSQLAVKQRFVADKTAANVQDALSAMQTARDRTQRSRLNAQLAQESLELARFQFQAGDINLIELNIFEQSATDARLQLIQAQADFFSAVADYRAAVNEIPTMW